MTSRYFDTGMNGPQDSLGFWLDQEIVTGIQSFRGQFGYFDGSALSPYLPILEDMINNGGFLKLVIGANPGDPASKNDLESLLSLTCNSENSSITLIAYSVGLFHPKTIHVVRENGTEVSVVSSANFTRNGLGHNIEAGLILNTSESSTQIAAAIDRWSNIEDDGVFQISTIDDINLLCTNGLAVSSTVRRDIRRQQRPGPADIGRGTLPIGWRPRNAANNAQNNQIATPPPVEEELVLPTTVTHHWAKKMARSDAQQVPEGTNPTGKLRLGQARFPIDQSTWFRNVFFRDLNWIQSVRRGVIYDEVHVPFRVSIQGAPWMPVVLKIDHADHRAANQRNVTTVLSWGHQLGTWLRNNSQVDNWVILEKDTNDQFWISFANAQPDWAP